MSDDAWGIWDANWLLSFALIGFTIALHAGGVVLILRETQRFWIKSRTSDVGEWRRTGVAIGVIALVAICLAVLHGIEAIVWAAAYLGLGALHTPAQAVLYSVDSMTTRGAYGFALPVRWRMMGALESLDGMLLFGISTAFLFAVMQRLVLSSQIRGRS